MNQYSVDTKLVNGHLELNNIPFPDNIEVKVFIVPKNEILSDLRRVKDEIAKKL